PRVRPAVPYTTRFRSVDRHGLDDGAVGQLEVQVAQLAVDANDDDVLARAEQVRARRARSHLGRFAVDGQGDLLGHEGAPGCSWRSEEHTSELQSRENL